MKPFPKSFALAFALLASCTTIPEGPVEMPLAFATPSEGRLMIVARRGEGFVTPLGYDYRVCNAGPAFALNVTWNLHDNGDPQSPAQPPLQALPPGSCIDLGAATSIQIQNGATQTVGLSGYVGRYRPRTFPPGFRIVPAPPGNPPLQLPGTPTANGEWRVTECTPVEGGGRTAERGQVFERKCRIPIPAPGNYRMCFDERTVERVDGGSSWPSGLISTVVSGRLVGVEIPGTDAGNPKWNPVIERSCRDYYAIHEARALIASDANYDARKVIAVRVNVASIR